MILRLASLDDVLKLDSLIAASVRGLGGGYYSPAQIEAGITHVFGTDTQLILDGTYFVVETGGEIAGCGGWSRRMTLYGGDQTKVGKTDGLLDPKVDAARIRAFFVHPDHARRGIGRRIIQECETAAIAEGFTKMLIVATLPGEPLYAASGYTVTRRIDIETPWGVSLPAAHMERMLTTPEAHPGPPEAGGRR